MIPDATNLNLKEAAGQLLCPLLRANEQDQWLRKVENEAYGSAFFNRQSFAEFTQCTERLQACSAIPTLVAADLEHGAMSVTDRSTPFPWSMAVAATGDDSLAYEMGRATAAEGHAAGIHWTFSPNIDINYNFRAPESNIRTFGDQPELVSRMGRAYVRGIQAEHHMAACAKHFPGTGIDERDQHLVTAVNPLSVEAWMKTYGRVWREVIQDGVLSVMVGHISFPAWQGFEHDIESALPATLCPRLMVDLLRNELGFDGLIVSDAAPMIGLTSRVPEADAVVEFIKAGGDVFLFAKPGRDLDRLLRAVQDGELTEERIYDAAGRILRLKQRLGLERQICGPAPSKEASAQFEASALEIARKSISIAKDNGKVGQPPPTDSRILTVTIDYENHSFQPQELEVFDATLREAGYPVDHWRNPNHADLIEKAPDYSTVFLNFHIVPHMLMGHTRLLSSQALIFWRSFYTTHPDVRCTSFGSPYLLYDQPHLPNLILAFGGVTTSQQAAVEVWLGKQVAAGQCPVSLPKLGLMSSPPNEWVQG